MKFAVPVDNTLNLYPDNPCAAPKFALYTIHGDYKNICYALLSVMENPWYKPDAEHSCDLQKLKSGTCNLEESKDIRHIAEHYIPLEVINGCSYLLVQNFCKTTRRCMRNAGIKIFQIPSFIKKTDPAIINFLIGAKIADSIEHIHYAS